MHVVIPLADIDEGHLIVTAETPEALAAELNVALLALVAAGKSVWDADLACVGASRFFMATLTLQDAAVAASAANPQQVRAFVFRGGTVDEALAARAYAYANDPNLAAGNLYLDKWAGGSNGREFWNLQIFGGV